MKKANIKIPHDNYFVIRANHNLVNPDKGIFTTQFKVYSAAFDFVLEWLPKVSKDEKINLVVARRNHPYLKTMLPGIEQALWIHYNAKISTHYLSSVKALPRLRRAMQRLIPRTPRHIK
ncbi:MAG: hypothetical protein V1494_03545 [Candidatus Diapherotrites archaeon]